MRAAPNQSRSEPSLGIGTTICLRTSRLQAASPDAIGFLGRRFYRRFTGV